jgi:hypothetical protein
MRRGLVIGAVGIALMVPRTARAQEGTGGAYEGIFILLAAGAVLALADTALLTVDMGLAANHDTGSTGYAVFEGAFGGLQSVVGGIFAVGGTGDESYTALAITSLPASVSMHGLWAGATGYDGFPFEVLPVAAIDTVVLSRDVVQMARGTPMDGFHGWMELIAAAPQSGFGLVEAASGRKQDVAPTLAFTALPALMLAHGIYAIVHKRHDEDASRAPTGRVAWTLAPLSPAPGAAGLGVIGAF